MFEVSRMQMDLFRRAVVKDYERRAIHCLRAFFPDRCEILGEVGTQKWIHLGIRRAGFYGIKKEYDVFLYLFLMFKFGADFDVETKGQLGQFLNILAEAKRDASERIKHIYHLAEEIEKSPPEADAKDWRTP